MKDQHTPGPWTVRNNENGTLGIDAHELDGTDCSPARINGNADDSVYGPVTRANARLIAAAPQMLALLREFAGYLQIRGSSPGMPPVELLSRFDSLLESLDTPPDTAEPENETR